MLPWFQGERLPFGPFRPPTSVRLTLYIRRCSWTILPHTYVHLGCSSGIAFHYSCLDQLWNYLSCPYPTIRGQAFVLR